MATRRRREQLMAEVRAGNGHINALADRFRVSVSTIRRDLSALARGGQVMRTYGGAVESGHGRERTLHAKQLAHRQEKDAIGRCAAGMVDPGDVLLLDAGTTVGRLAWHLRDRDDITVITNGLPTLLALADAPGVEVIVLGGRLRRPNEAFLGPEVEHALRRYHPDLAFLGVDGIAPDRGLNCPSPEQACLKEVMSVTARNTWVLADHSKLGAEPFPYWATMPAGMGLITDEHTGTVDARDWTGWNVLTTPVSPGKPHRGSASQGSSPSP